MSYTKHTWADTESGGTPIVASKLNEMEQGIYDANQPATTSKDGLMSALDKTKLDNIGITVEGKSMTITVS